MNRSIVAVTAAIALVLTGGSATVAFGLADGGGDGGCARVPDGPVAAKAVLKCVAPSLAFIETALGSGSGILVGGRYIVTNAHVVEPFAAVDVVFPGGEHHDDVEVKGVDLVADIALLGPVDTQRRVLPIADYDGTKGDDLFLVGFPGEVDDEPDPTISRGILSRTRTVEDFDLTFFQTDASIGGGQSGGALVDDRGQVVGVSGFSFAEEFALALSGGDTRSSIERILDGDVPDYLPFPEDSGATSGTFEVVGGDGAQVLTAHTGDEAETVRLTLPADLDPILVVTDWMGDVFLQNRAAFEAMGSTDDFAEFDPEEFGLLNQVAPGVHEFELPEDTYVMIFVGTSRPGPVEMRFISSLPLGRYDDVDEDRRLRIGQRVEGVLDSLEIRGDGFLINLREGQEVEISARSATGDVGFAITGPGRRSPDVYVDDSDEGLFGVDAKETFTAERSGEHRITVFSADGRATAYVLEVERT